MRDEILETPIELWIGLIALIGGAITKDNTLIIISAVLLGTARILSETRSK